MKNNVINIVKNAKFKKEHESIVFYHNNFQRVYEVIKQHIENLEATYGKDVVHNLLDQIRQRKAS